MLLYLYISASGAQEFLIHPQPVTKLDSQAMTMNTYDIDYFIAKFSAIPDEQWCIGYLNFAGRHCALGHCGAYLQNIQTVKETDESDALNKLFVLAYGVPAHVVNDYCREPFPQPTPKARILAALYDVKARAEAALEAYELRELKPTSKPEPATA